MSYSPKQPWKDDSIGKRVSRLERAAVLMARLVQVPSIALWSITLEASELAEIAKEIESR